MKAKEQLSNWLANNDLQKVLNSLFFLADEYKDESLRKDAIFQSGRLKAMEEQRIKDTISFEDYSLQMAKIRDALLQIIQDITNDWTLDGMEIVPVAAPTLSSINWKKYAVYTVGVIALFAGIVELSEYRLRDVFQKKDASEIPSETHPLAPKVSTSGDNSPAIQTNDGDVNINYGEPTPKKDSTHIPQTTKQ